MKNLKRFLLFFYSCIFVINSSFSGTPLSSLPGNPGKKINNNTFINAGAPQTVELFRTDLYALNDDGTTSLEDGVLLLYNNAYSDTVNWLEDAKKLTNFAENFAMQRGKLLLSIEKRRIIGETDSVFYNMTQMRQKSYKIMFTAGNLNHPNLIGFVHDSYTGISTPLDLNGSTILSFSVTTDPGSYNPNRFRVIFTTTPLLSIIVPVTYTSVKAWQQNNNIAVEWKTENEISIAKYEVEKSVDGAQFNTAGTVAYSGQLSSTYNWVDINPSNGNNFYRVKAISTTGQVQYSQILKASVSATADKINVYPNPAVGGTIGLKMNNFANGIYEVRLLNNFGAVLLSKTISHQQGNATETISVSQNIGKGVYRLELVKPDNTITNTNVVF